jgi:hypothetical protein
MSSVLTLRSTYAYIHVVVFLCLQALSTVIVVSDLGEQKCQVKSVRVQSYGSRVKERTAGFHFSFSDLYKKTSASDWDGKEMCYLEFSLENIFIKFYVLLS